MQAEGVPSPHGHPGNKTEPYTPQDWSLNNIVELLVAERCAPLVEALHWVQANSAEPHAQAIADDALAAYRAAQGAGRET